MVMVLIYAEKWRYNWRDLLKNELKRQKKDVMTAGKMA